jgi:preprotein translocase subunit SecG
MSPHCLAIFLQHARSADVMSAFGTAQDITGSAANIMAAAKIPTLRTRFKHHQCTHSQRLDATGRQKFQITPVTAYSAKIARKPPEYRLGRRSPQKRSWPYTLSKMSGVAIPDRTQIVRRARRLEYFTIGWNAFEGLVAIATGVIASSISLVGFGIDSFIEVTSGSVLLWRMSVDADELRREGNERQALRILGVCFLLLAAYLSYESATDLWSGHAPQHSLPGIILACVSLIVMPLLSKAKRKVGRALGSAAMHADAKQTEFCTYLSAILLSGLLLNAFFGLWWADPAAALVMTPIIVKEGIEGLRGQICTNCCAGGTANE